MLDSLIFSLNAVVPIFAMVIIGFVLKKIGFIDVAFAKKANKIVFRLFLPVLLFSNVYKINNLSEIKLGYVAYAAIAVVLIMLISLPIVMGFTKEKERRGVLLQATFRSNYALVGIPLAGALFGAEGEIVASLLSVVSVPLLNIVAVFVLTIFNKDNAKRPSLLDILKGIVKNPLIQAIFTGLLVLLVRAVFERIGVEFRLSDITPLMKLINYLSNLATPLALVALGAQFEFSQVKGMRRELIFGVLAKTAVVPLITLTLAYILFKDVFFGAEFAALVALFATPISVSSVPMSQEMGADSELAGQLVVWTTAFSSVTIFVTAFIFRLLGVF